MRSLIGFVVLVACLVVPLVGCSKAEPMAPPVQAGDENVKSQHKPPSKAPQMPPKAPE